MSIPIQCDCGRSLSVKDELAGRKIRCPKCQAVLKVPESEPEEIPEIQPMEGLVKEGAPPPRKAGAAKKRAAAAADDDDEDEDRVSKSTRKSKRDDADGDDDDERVSKSKRKSKRDDPDDDDDDRASKSKRKSRRDEEDNDDEEDEPDIRRRRKRTQSSSSGFAVRPAIIAGILMMFGSVAWFCAGLLLADTIFFYPPILFICGIVAFIRGCMGYQD